MNVCAIGAKQCLRQRGVSERRFTVLLDVRWHITERIKSTLRQSARQAAPGRRDPDANGNGNFMNIRKPRAVPLMNFDDCIRFMKKVCKDARTSCWVWCGVRTMHGYGQMRMRGHKEKFLVHRLSYRYYCGKIPENFVLMHKCDNPSCVNPNHLTTGDTQENVWDRINKGRHGGCVEVKNRCPF